MLEGYTQTTQLINVMLIIELLKECVINMLGGGAEISSLAGGTHPQKNFHPFFICNQIV